MLNVTLKTLLNYSKAGSVAKDWRSIAKALAPIYAFEPSGYDVVRIVTREYFSAVTDVRFELSRPENSILDLIMSPVSGLTSLGFYALPPSSEQHTIEDFYNAMLAHMIGNLSIARVDWCKNELVNNLGA